MWLLLPWQKANPLGGLSLLKYPGALDEYCRRMRKSTLYLKENKSRGKTTRDLSCMLQEPLEPMQDKPFAGNQVSALSTQHATSLVLHGLSPAH